MFNPLALSGFVLASRQLASVGARTFDITNSCPTSVDLYINGENQGPIASGATTSRTFDDNWSGYIYTDANGGNASGVNTTKAGFYGPVSFSSYLFGPYLNRPETDYYYLVVDPAHFNTKIAVSVPSLPPVSISSRC